MGGVERYGCPPLRDVERRPNPDLHWFSPDLRVMYEDFI
jgi:hypothetical protein